MATRPAFKGEPPRRATIATDRFLRALVFCPDDADSRSRAIARLRAEVAALGDVVVAPAARRERSSWQTFRHR